MQAPCQTADVTQSRRSRSEDLPFLDLFGEPPNVAFEAPVALTSNRERTPQGWLKIKDVVIARLGVQDYHASELPLEPGPTGYIVIERLEEDLFAPEAIASFEGVPIVDEHPRDAAGMPHMLDSATTIPVLRGVLTNVRRGTGDQARYMMGDAILYCDKTIGLVEAGKRQVSAGYTADYMRLEAGRGRQINFRGNHLAIVHRGRCGEECAFGDEEPQHMTTAHQPAEPARSAVPRLRGRTSLRDVKLARILHAFRTGDEDLAAAELDAALPEENTVADPLEDIRAAIAQLKDGLAALQARMDAANEAPAAAAEVAEAVQEVAEAAAEMAGDESLPDEMTTDAAFRDTLSRGEVLAPGLGVPTGDAVATPAARGKTIIALQRRALDKAWDAHQGIRPIFGTAAKPTFDAMPAAALRGYFIAASEQVRAANRQPVLPAGLMPTIDGSTHRPPSAAERQKAFDDFWGRKRA